MKTFMSLVLVASLAALASGCGKDRSRQGPGPGQESSAMPSFQGPAAGAAPMEAPPPAGDLLGFVSDIAAVPGLDEDQRQKMDALWLAAVKEILPRQAAQKVLSAEVTALLLAEKPDAAAVSAKVAQAYKLAGELADIDFRMLVAAKGLMNADQVKAFDRRLLGRAESLFDEGAASPGGGPQGGTATAGAPAGGMPAGGPGMGQPGMGGPGMGQPGMGGPGMGQPGMGGPGMGQPGMGGPGMGQPGMGQPGMGGSGMGQPGMGGPGMGQQGTGGAAVAAVDPANLPPCDGRPGPCQAACPLNPSAKAPKK